MTTSKNLRRGVVITRVPYATPLPPTLTFEGIEVQFVKPHTMSICLRAEGDACYSTRLLTPRNLADDSMVGADILPGDLLIYDGDRTAPIDGAIVFVQDGKDSVPRIARVDGDTVEYHPAAEGYPILSGERKVWGTVAALVRVYGALETAPDAEEGSER